MRFWFYSFKICIAKATHVCILLIPTCSSLLDMGPCTIIIMRKARVLAQNPVLFA